MIPIDMHAVAIAVIEIQTVADARFAKTFGNFPQHFFELILSSVLTLKRKFELT